LEFTDISNILASAVNIEINLIAIVAVNALLRMKVR